MYRRSLIVKLFVPTWLVFFVIPTPVEAAFINGTFDLPGLPPGDPAQGISLLFMPSLITGWLAVPGFDGTNGIADYLHDDRSQDPGGYFVELGVMFTNIGLQQTFTSIPNQSYALTFWLGTRIPFAPNDVRVSAGVTSADFLAVPPTGGSGVNWQQHSFFFTSDESGLTNLLFQNLGGVADLDTITVDAVPEPPTYALLGIGMVWLGIFGYSRKTPPGSSSRAGGSLSKIRPCFGVCQNLMFLAGLACAENMSFRHTAQRRR